MSVATIYCKEIRSNFRKYFGNWEPTESINLGDIGIIENNMFIHKGNINSFGINGLEIEEQDAGNKSFSSKGSVSVDFSGKTSSEQLNSKAGLKISFSKGNSIYLNAVGCRTKRFSDKIKLGNKILDLYKVNRSWKKNWVIVTDIILSKNTTIAISESANSSINLIAQSEMIEEINMLDTDLSLSIACNNQVGYCAESKRNIIPFIGVCAIKDTWFESAKFETLTTKQFIPSFKGGGKLTGFMQAEIEQFGQLI